MGYGLPAAIAAALVHRDRPVVALVGDGGLAMTMAELETAVRVGARVVVVVFDNERYGTIRMWQERRGTGVGVATRARTGRFRGDRAGLRRARRPGRARRRLRAGPAGRPRGRSARRSSSWRSTGAGLSIDQPPGLIARTTFHLVPVDVWAAADPAAPVRGRVARGRGLHPLHGRRRTRSARRSTATTRTIRGRSWR